MFIPPSAYELIQRGMDKWRPGWRERAAERKSPWDFIGILLGFLVFPIIWFYLFQATWLPHVHFYPMHAGHEREFWGHGVSTRALISSFLMALPLG
jgi:hypothetical protein